MKASRISSLREKKSVQSNSQWEHTLLNTLLQQLIIPEEPNQHPKERIETVASLSPSRLTLIFRKNISGITQRLGEITLHQDDAIEIDPLSWTSLAIAHGDALEAHVSDLTAKHASAQQNLSALNQQLEELITAKQAHEIALLSKFKVLLNAKKVKIRDQQRLLAQAKVRGTPQGAQDATRGADETGARHIPSESKRGKRKADEAELGDGGEDVEEDEEAAFEGPASSTRVKNEVVDEDGDGMLQTPDASDEDITEDEDEEEQESGGGDRQVRGDGSDSQRMQVDASPPSISDLPPDRDLPFEKAEVKRQDQTAQRQRQEAQAEDQETDDDDDEL